jgi:hypothetical protein
MLSCEELIPFAIKNFLNGERFWPFPPEEGERPHKVAPTPIQKLFASSEYYTIEAKAFLM